MPVLRMRQNVTHAKQKRDSKKANRKPRQYGTGELAVTKAQRAELKMMFNGRCAYCGCVLSDKWHADHIDPVLRGADFKQENDIYENLVPACPQCNRFKSVHSVEQFRSEIEKQAERARLYSVNFRTAERFGLVSVIEKPVIFYFERYKKVSAGD